MNDIFQEVDEELRKDKLEKLWKDYRRYFLGLTSICVLCVGAWQGWKSYSVGKLLSSSKQYELALNFNADGKNEDVQGTADEDTEQQKNTESDDKKTEDVVDAEFKEVKRD